VFQIIPDNTDHALDLDSYYPTSNQVQTHTAVIPIFITSKDPGSNPAQPRPTFISRFEEHV